MPPTSPLYSLSLFLCGSLLSADPIRAANIPPLQIDTFLFLAMWKRQLIGFEILVDTIVDMFGPPDTNEVFELQGKVRVVTSKPLNLKGLLVSFHGTTQVNKEDKPRKVLSYMNLTLNDMSLLSPDTPSVLPAGVSDFPFKVSWL